MPSGQNRIHEASYMGRAQTTSSARASVACMLDTLFELLSTLVAYSSFHSSPWDERIHKVLDLESPSTPCVVISRLHGPPACAASGPHRRMDDDEMDALDMLGLALGGPACSDVDIAFTRTRFARLCPHDS